MSVEIITKRYYIEGFNSFAISTNEDKAFGALKEIEDRLIQWPRSRM